MEFKHLLRLVGAEPVFETGLLLAGDVDPVDVRKQLSRWKAAGKIFQLRRGLYSLAPPYQKTVPHPFLVANRLVPGSCVSLRSALAHHGMLPGPLPAVTSVTAAHSATHRTAFGSFDFHHIQAGWLHTFRRIELADGQWAHVAAPEKALLDLIYLQPGADQPASLRSLRLQAVDQLDMDLLERLVSAAGKPKLRRALKVIRKLADEETTGYRPLG
jgi:predicted transcriptional regulator of viral defense system